jgi:predicted DNA-binding protein YlxM (UPF0122 family)
MVRYYYFQIDTFEDRERTKLINKEYFVSVKLITEKYGISRQQIYNIMSGRTKRTFFKIERKFGNISNLPPPPYPGAN